MKLPDAGSLHSRIDLQRTFAFPDIRHVGEVSMPDLRFQRRSDPVLALQKKGVCKVCTGNGVMRDKAAVRCTTQVFSSAGISCSLRGENSPRFASTSGGVPGEQHQSAGARRHRWAPVRLTTRQAAKSDPSRVKCPRVSKVKRAIRLYESPRRIDGPSQLSLL